MFDILRKWFRTYFSDEEAVYLFLMLVGGLLVVMFLGRMLAPALAALVLAYLMQGLINTLRRYGVGPRLSFALVYLLFVTLLMLALGVLLPMVWRQTTNLVQFQLPGVLAGSEAWLKQLPQRYPDIISMEQVQQLVTAARAELAHAGQSLVSLSLSSIPDLVQAMIFLVLVPLLVFFFLKDRDLLLRWILRFLPDRRRVMASVWKEMDLQIANYVRGKAVEIVLVAVVSFVSFIALDLHYALLLAVLVGLSVVVPYVGATVVTLPVAAVGWVQFGWSTDFAMVMLVYGVIQFIDGNILVPLLFSEAVNLHPVAIILAILVFGGLWGFWGVFFAIPLATLLKAVLDVWPNGGSPGSAGSATA